jgi:1,4-dihydroxy-2-naphthoate octaprenyltransferase
MTSFKSYLNIMRAPFLVLAPACVAVGLGTAFWQMQELNWLQVLLMLVGGLAAHICVNSFNEYFDFKSGLDARTKRTPFSGGSGTLPANPEMERAALTIAVAALVLTAIIGIYFVILQGWHLLVIGILGLFLLVSYTTLWVYNPILSLIAPGLGFGILMVMGTHFALTGTLTWTAVIASLVPTFLVSNLLLLNQFPDVEADQSIGRKSLPIIAGRNVSAQIYGLQLLLTYLSIILGVILKILPAFSLIALATSILSWRNYQQVRRNAEDIPALIPSMGMNVIIILLTLVLLAIGLFIG